LKRPKEALAEYKVALTLSPNRLNGLYGAGRAAETLGMKKEAGEYYAAILKNSDDGARSSRPSVAHAKAFVDGKVVFFGVGETPVAAGAAVAALTGRSLTEEVIARAEAALDTDLNPPADQHASSAMRRHLARVLLGRALRRLCGKEEARVA